MIIRNNNSNINRANFCDPTTFNIAYVSKRINESLNSHNGIGGSKYKPTLKQVMSSFSEFHDFLHRLFDEISAHDGSGNLMYLLFNDDWSPQLLARAAEIERTQGGHYSYDLMRLDTATLNTLKRDFCLYLVAYTKNVIIIPAWQRKLDNINNESPRMFFEQLTDFVTEHHQYVQTEQTVLNISAHLRNTTTGIKSKLSRNEESFYSYVNSTKLMAYLIHEKGKRDPDYAYKKIENIDTPIKYLKGEQFKYFATDYDIYKISPNFKSRYRDYTSEINRFEEFYTKELKLIAKTTDNPITKFAIDYANSITATTETDSKQVRELKRLLVMTNEAHAIHHATTIEAYMLSQREIYLHNRGVLLSGVNNKSVLKKLTNSKPHLIDTRYREFNIGDIAEIESEQNYPRAQIVKPITNYSKTIFEYGSRDSDFNQIKAKLCRDYQEYNEAVKKNTKKPNTSGNNSNNDGNKNTTNNNNSNTSNSNNENNNNNNYNNNNNFNRNRGFNQNNRNQTRAANHVEQRSRQINWDNADSEIDLTNLSTPDISDMDGGVYNVGLATHKNSNDHTGVKQTGRSINKDTNFTITPNMKFKVYDSDELDSETLIDSGASVAVINDKNLFYELEERKTVLDGPSGSGTVTSYGQGKVVYMLDNGEKPFLRSFNAYFVPCSRYNLIPEGFLLEHLSIGGLGKSGVEESPRKCYNNKDEYIYGVYSPRTLYTYFNGSFLVKLEKPNTNTITKKNQKISRTSENVKDNHTPVNDYTTSDNTENNESDGEVEHQEVGGEILFDTPDDDADFELDPDDANYSYGGNPLYNNDTSTLVFERRESPKTDSTNLEIRPTSQALVWHNTYNHAPTRQMKKLFEVNNQNIPITKYDEELIANCPFCSVSKFTRNFKPEEHANKFENSAPLSTIHADITGYYPYPDLSGNRYALTIVDGYSNYVTTITIQTKDQATQKLIDWINKQENYFRGKTNYNVKRLQCDNGSEFTNNEFRQFCSEKGIEITFSPPDEPSRNGKVERFNRTIEEKAQAACQKAGLPHEFYWSFAKIHASLVYNYVALDSNNKSPYELFCGKAPNTKGLLPFGCRIDVPRTGGDLHSPRGCLAIYLGQGSNGRLRLYECPFNGRMATTGSGKPHPTEFPGRNMTFDKSILQTPLNERTYPRQSKTTNSYFSPTFVAGYMRNNAEVDYFEESTFSGTDDEFYDNTFEGAEQAIEDEKIENLNRKYNNETYVNVSDDDTSENAEDESFSDSDQYGDCDDGGDETYETENDENGESSPNPDTTMTDAENFQQSNIGENQQNIINENINQPDTTRQTRNVHFEDPMDTDEDMQEESSVNSESEPSNESYEYTIPRNNSDAEESSTTSSTTYSSPTRQQRQRRDDGFMMSTNEPTNSNTTEEETHERHVQSSRITELPNDSTPMPVTPSNNRNYNDNRFDTPSVVEQVATSTPFQRENQAIDQQLISRNSNQQLVNTNSERQISTSNNERQLSTTNSNRQLSTTNSERQMSTTNSERQLSTTNSERQMSTTNSERQISMTNSERQVSTTNGERSIVPTNFQDRLAAIDEELNNRYFSNRPIEAPPERPLLTNDDFQQQENNQMVSTNSNSNPYAEDTFMTETDGTIINYEDGVTITYETDTPEAPEVPVVEAPHRPVTRSMTRRLREQAGNDEDIRFINHVSSSTVYKNSKQETFQVVKSIEGNPDFIRVPCREVPKQDSEKWLEKMDGEMVALKVNKVYKLVKLPPGFTPLRVRWVLVKKYDANGDLERYKARLVVRGYLQKEGINYGETFSPVARYDTVRLVFAIATKFNHEVVHMDFTNAFQFGEIDYEIYVTQPPGYLAKGKEDHVLKLEKSLYGLKQAPLCWSRRLNKAISKLGYKATIKEPCLYVKEENGRISIICTYVDDLLVSTPIKGEVDRIYQAFTDEGLVVKNLGFPSKFLGMRVTKKDDTIRLDLKTYIKDLVEFAGLQHANPEITPFKSSVKLEKLKPEEAGKPIKDPKLFRSIIGKLIFASNTCRPDISTAVSILSQYLKEPREAHLTCAKTVVKYLHNTADFSLKFKNTEGAPLVVGYADANLTNNADSKSRSGYIIKIYGNIVSWMSKKQTRAAQSSAESELYALNKAVKEMLYFRDLLGYELGLQLEGASTIYEDNQPCIDMAKQPKINARTRYIRSDHMMIHECVEKNEISVEHIGTKKMLADGFTKILPAPEFRKFYEDLDLVPDDYQRRERNE